MTKKEVNVCDACGELCHPAPTSVMMHSKGGGEFDVPLVHFKYIQSLFGSQPQRDGDCHMCVRCSRDAATKLAAALIKQLEGME